MVNEPRSNAAKYDSTRALVRSKSTTLTSDTGRQCDGCKLIEIQYVSATPKRSAT